MMALALATNMAVRQKYLSVFTMNVHINNLDNLLSIPNLIPIFVFLG